MKKNITGRIIIICLILLLIFFFYWLGIGEKLSLNYLKEQHAQLQGLVETNYWPMLLGFGAFYVLATALSLPGAAVLTVAAGAFFGFLIGTLLVSFASTIGATLAFLFSRYLLRDWVQSRYGERLKKLNAGIAKEGLFYLFTLRLVPIFPFFIINLLMGLTPMRAVSFYIVSQIGMLPGTIVYVNAGGQLANIDSLSDLMSPTLLFSFALIGILPLLTNAIVKYFHSQKYSRKFPKPKSWDYNLAVLGAGSAGLVTTYIGVAIKAKVALIEKNKMGGDCLNTGCVPSKALIQAAKVVYNIKNAHKFGVSPSVDFKVDFEKVMERIQTVIQKIEPHDSVERYTRLGADCIQGEAKILSPHEVEVNGKVISAKNIVLATGASPQVPPIPGLNTVSYLTSDDLWKIRKLPEKLVILGGGPIGCELAQSFSRLGSKVTVVEMGKQLVAKEDPDISALILDVFQTEGIEVLREHKVTEVREGLVICQTPTGEKQVPFDNILLALGRKANISGFGLEDLNIELNRMGNPVVDEYLRLTRYPSIYACGDLVGPYQFTHAAAHQAWHAAVNALFHPIKKFKVDYRVLPWCTFTDPEIARVGLNETEAKALNLDYQVSSYGMDNLDRAIADGTARGFVKVLTQKKSDKILGVSIIGPHAGEIINEYVFAMKHGLGLNKILGTIHVYPTYSEAAKFAAGVWKKNNAPEGILKLLEKYHNFRRR